MNFKKSEVKTLRSREPGVVTRKVFILPTGHRIHAQQWRRACRPHPQNRAVTVTQERETLQDHGSQLLGESAALFTYRIIYTHSNTKNRSPAQLYVRFKSDFKR